MREGVDKTEPFLSAESPAPVYFSLCHSLCFWALRQHFLKESSEYVSAIFFQVMEKYLGILILVSSWFYQKVSKKDFFFAKNKGLSTIVLKWFAMETRRGPGPGSLSRYTSVCYVSAMSVANGISKIHPLFEQVNNFGGERFVFVKQQQQKTSEKTDELHVSASTISRNSLCWLGFANSNHMSQAGNWVKWERRCCSYMETLELSFSKGGSWTSSLESHVGHILWDREFLDTPLQDVIRLAQK